MTFTLTRNISFFLVYFLLQLCRIGCATTEGTVVNITVDTTVNISVDTTKDSTVDSTVDTIVDTTVDSIVDSTVDSTAGTTAEIKRLCPVDIDPAYVGEYNDGECLTLISRDEIASIETLNVHSANAFCFKTFSGGHLRSYNIVHRRKKLQSYTNFYQDLLHTPDYQTDLPNAGKWNFAGISSTNNLANGIKVTNVDVSHEGNVTFSDIRFLYFNGTIETVRAKIFRGVVYLDTFPIFLNYHDFFNLITTIVRQPLCFYVPLEGVAHSALKPFHSISNALIENRIIGCDIPQIVDHFICASLPFEWCTVREIDQNNTKKCQCAVGRKNVKCSNIPCKKHESFKQGTQCITPELIEKDPIEKEKKVMLLMIIVIGSVALLLVLLIIAFSWRRRKKQHKKKHKEASLPRDKKGTTIEAVQVDLNDESVKKPSSSMSKSKSQSGSPMP